MSGSPGTSAGDRSAVRNFKATPQDIYDGLLRTANVCFFICQRRNLHTRLQQQPQDHAQGISSLAFAFASILDVSYVSSCVMRALIITSFLCLAEAYHNLTPGTINLALTCRHSTVQMRRRQIAYERKMAVECWNLTLSPRRGWTCFRIQYPRCLFCGTDIITYDLTHDQVAFQD